MLFELLETCFPGIGWAARLARMRALGAAWEQVSKPFMRFDGGRAVSHVGVMSVPLVTMGKRGSVGAVHAVCTRPGYRRRGHFRSCMEEALRYCDERFETLFLTTGQPELYVPFGFRVLEEHRFGLSLPAAARPAPAGEEFRGLRAGSPEDLSLLRKLLEGRRPVSEVLGAEGEVAIFAFDEALRPLLYAEDLGAVVSAEIEGRTLHLFDVVSDARDCTVAELVARLPRTIERVYLYFAPDLRADARGAAAEPHVLDGDDRLMARGPFAAEGRPFMLPRTTRC